MKVDLSKLEGGQTVKFFCGGEAVPEDVYEADNGVYLKFKGSRSTYYYCNGSFQAGQKHPFDIIEIVPKPFDWDTVEPGMAFSHEHGAGETYFYVGWNPHGLIRKDVCVTKKDPAEDRLAYGQSCICYLTRTPEKDL